MIQSLLNKSIIRLFLALILLMAGVTTITADQSRYFYDELGRLIAVSDGHGNMAVYNYDPVGNLLSIQKFTSSTTGIGIFLMVPSLGTVTTPVQIQGYGFDSIASNNQVSFNGTAATVNSSTANSIMTSVPPNATTGPVTVTNSNGTAISPNSFTVLQTPVITAISPSRVTQGSTNYNTIITGFNLTNATSVSFNQAGIISTILSGGTSTQLHIDLKVSGTVPSGSYPFSVITTEGSAQSGTVIVNVYPPVPEVAVSLKLSVFLPLSPQEGSTGPKSVTGNPLSIFLPYVSGQAPPGPDSVITTPLSVFNPPPAMVSPSGSDTAVAPPESVSMP